MFNSKEQFINTFKIILLLMLGMPILCGEETTTAKTEGDGAFVKFLTKPTIAYIMFGLIILLIMLVIFLGYLVSKKGGDEN